MTTNPHCPGGTCLRSAILFLLLSLLVGFPTAPTATLAAAPVLMLTTDKASYGAGEIVNISGELFDEENPTALAIVSVMINEPIGSIISVSQATTDQSGAYQSSYPLAADADSGVYQITVAAEGTLAQVDFAVGNLSDPSPPTSAILSPANGTALASSPIRITGTATDNLGLRQVEVSVDGGASWALAGGTYSWVFLWMHPDSGTHIIQSRATDVAGNRELSNSGITVTIGPSATPTPTATVTPSPTPTFSPSVTPTLSPPLTPTLVPSLPSLPVFPDIEFHWARASIEHLAKLRLVNGYPDGFYRPDNPVTRMEFTKILVLALGLDQEIPSQVRFADVGTNHWGFIYVEAAAYAGIVNGVGEGQFAPERNITRAEIATMISRALKLKPQTPSFTDAASIPPYAVGMVGAASIKGIVKGYPDGTFRPANLATRAEAAAMIDRMLALLA
jgi:hypothetical protein